MMRKEFRQKIRTSIGDANLQTALDNNARRRREARLATLASLPDLPERRKRTHAVREDVITHLDEYLARFSANAAANGILLHRAADANQAVELFLEIASRFADDQGQLLVAKSKSMISEEIDLNHALDCRGIRVVETDLGEYIVQLRGERPSHIITPAVHLRRGDVGKLFEEKLGLPYTEDIPTLTNTARKVLRQVFLEAQVGLSGVNFGVAESGTLCLVTNEGNGRMVTTLPRVHIALMGIERLLPTLDDLALFLSLLPRSATGQKLSVYTSLIHAPFPGQERHLILLDNGRQALRQSPLAESLYCIRCGACLNACPVFRELGGHAYGSIYPGPIGSVISGALVSPEHAALAQASSLCGACREACPVDIDLPTLLTRVRAGQSPEVGMMEAVTPAAKELPNRGVGLPAFLKAGLSLFRRAAGSAFIYGSLQQLAGVFSRLWSPRREYLHLPSWTGWGLSKDMPRFDATPFRRRWSRLKQDVAPQSTPAMSVEKAPAAPPVPALDLSAQFTTELTALGGAVHPVALADLPTALAKFILSRVFGPVCADEEAAAYLSGMEVTPGCDPSVRCGVTGVVCGIADTGSLLLASGAGETLTASLLPEVHIALLRRSRLLPTLADALRLPEARRAGAVVITGSSRTADIEMTLTIGVHGPGEVHVFLIDDSGTT